MVYISSYEDGRIHYQGQEGVEDIELLLLVAEKANYRNKPYAIQTALFLSGDKRKTIKVLLDNSDWEIVKKALMFALDNNIEIDDTLCISKLHSDQEQVRLGHLAFLCKRKNHEFLEKLLDNYIGSNSCYYNVISYLDRTLYAPIVFRSIYMERLFKYLK